MYFICGPTPFNESFVEILKVLDVKERRVLVELNGPPSSPQWQNGLPQGIGVSDTIIITVNGDKSFLAKVGEPLLNSLERNVFSAKNACRSGECSLCRIKLIAGEVFNPNESRLRKSDKKFGWIYPTLSAVSSSLIRLG